MSGIEKACFSPHGIKGYGTFTARFIATTHAANTNRKTPAIRDARRSARSCAPFLRKHQNTTTADANSTALSPPKAGNPGLRARYAARSEIAASTLIQPIVIALTRWMCRAASVAT